MCAMCPKTFVPTSPLKICCSQRCAEKHSYYEKPDHYRAKARRERRDNPERAKDIGQKSDNKRRDKRLPEMRERELNRRIRHPWNGILGSAKSRKTGIPSDLTTDWARSRWTGKCELTGIEFRTVRGEGIKGPQMFSASIDKIDPKLGYVKLGYVQSNCRFILFAVNVMKNRGSDADLYRIAEALLANRPK